MMDKLLHFILCMTVTMIFNWKIGTTVGITIELTQAEYGNADVRTFRDRLLSYDTVGDLIADAAGVIIGRQLKLLIKKDR